MKHLEITVPEGHEVDKENSTFEKIVFKKIRGEYPQKVYEIRGRNYYISTQGIVKKVKGDRGINNLSTKSRAEAFLALMQLIELRDAWNEIDGGKEWNWGSLNHIICVDRKEIRVASYSEDYAVLHFRKEKTRNLFFETFIDLIEQAKELI